MHKDDLGPATPAIDEVAFALERVCTYLLWIDEHRTSFEANQLSKPEDAAAELAKLADATRQAQRYAKHLAELLVGGRTVDATKQLPRGLGEVCRRLAEMTPEGPE